MIKDALDAMPIVAILRGITPGEVQDIGNVLYGNGVRCIEVPLNSPSPFDSIRVLAETMPADCLVGAGTVLATDDVRKVKAAGGALIVAPNTDAEVISTAIEEGMEVMPGFATPTEAFDAIRLGAKYLKLFPAVTYGPDHLRALLAVLPRDVGVLAVGDIGAQNFAKWRAAGAVGFGIGSELYTAGDGVGDVEAKVMAVREAIS